MTVFNVRLGWWLGNPRHRQTWNQAGPKFGLFYLLNELFGLTSDESRYVYLSDGGHFENLGIYELVRRRCRFIVCCDATGDPEMTFADLGNAIRKCSADFSIDIELDLSPIRCSPESHRSLWHCAVGAIHYERVDPNAFPGTLLYIKASLTGDEGADILNYAAMKPHFPHQSTADQWFEESQFESYRKLGYHIARTVFKPALDAASAGGDKVNSEALFVKLRQHWYPKLCAPEHLFSSHSRVLMQIYEKIRRDANLEFLDAQVFPEWLKLTEHAEPKQPPVPADEKLEKLWLPKNYDEIRAGFYICNQMIQLMENVYLDLKLEQEYDHPDTRGWMNLFKHWSWSGMFRVTWAISAGTYGLRFQSFCQRRLGLTLGEVIAAGTGTVAGSQRKRNHLH